MTEQDENTRDNQVVVATQPYAWMNGQRIYHIHLGPEGGTFGYCDLAPLAGVTVLVRQLPDWPVVWQIVGWLRK